jgi:hypothetical protein
MPEHDHNPPHGEPGHECVHIDATTAVAGVIIRPIDLPDHPEGQTAFEVEAWANGMPKPVLAGFLRTVADSWDEEHRAETAELN